MAWPAFLRPLLARGNAIALARAGRAGSLADLQHVGRRSGTMRHTPVRAFRRGDVVVVGANFGRRSDWVRNVVAAGSARMRLGGRVLDLTAPEVVTLEEAADLFPAWFALGLRIVVRTDHCVVFRVAATGSLGPRAAAS